MALMVVIIIAVLLYLLAYTGRRRFGVLGLGLAAGTVLARSVGVDASQYIASSNVSVAPLSYDTTVVIFLTLLPALVLLAGGPTYAKKKQARLGAILFAVLATLLIVGPLTADVPTADAAMRQVLESITKWQGYIVAAGIALAVVDVLQYKPPKEPISGK